MRFLIATALFALLGLGVWGEDAKAPVESKPEANAPPATEAAKPIPIDQIAAMDAPKPAALLLAGDTRIPKAWVEVKDKGLWVTFEGQRYWYLKSGVVSVTWLAAADAELEEWLKQAEEARKAEEARAQLADAQRAADQQEEAKANAEAAAAAGSGSGSPATTSNTTSGSGASGAASGGGGGGGSASGGSPASGGAGGSQVGVAQGGGGGGGGGGPVRRGDGVDDNFRLLHGSLALQWRIVEINRKEQIVKLKNRAFKQFTTLEVSDPEDMAHLKKGMILEGMLNVQDPKLAAPDGETIEFKLLHVP